MSLPLLPGRTWEEIKVAFDLQELQEIVAIATGDYDAAIKAMEEAAGNGAAGTTAPASPPPIPAATSSAESPALTAAPCGAS